MATTSSRLKFRVRLWQKVVLTLMGLWLVLVGIVWVATLSIISQFLLQISPKTFLTGQNILVLGLDDSPDVQRSDTIMVVHIDPLRQKIGVLSIPRDTRFHVPGLGETKINAAYAKGKAPLAKEVVSALLGFPIHHCIVMKLAGVAHIVDRLGGVRLTIQRPLHYVDHAGHLYIDLQPGNQTLNGDQALQFLRFRHDVNGDIGRIARQQSFIQAFRQQLFSGLSLLKLPLLITDLYHYIDTDFSIPELMGLASQLQTTIQSGRIDTQTLPGDPEDIHGGSYWVLRQPEANTMIAAFFEGSSKNDTLPAPVSPAPTVAPTEPQPLARTTEADIAPPPSQIALRAEILNGFGDPSAVEDTVKLIQLHGVRVAHTGSAGSTTYDQTMLVDWKGNVERVLALARLLSIDPSRIMVYDRPEKSVDVTIVLGKDWPLLKARTGR